MATIENIRYDRQQYSFPEKFDLPPRLVASANRFKYLKSLENPTNDESNELASLLNVLAQYTMSAVEWNNLFRCMNNMQDFMLTDVMNWLNTVKDDMAESAQACDDKKTEVDNWWAWIRTSISAQTTFDFDNILTISGDFVKTTNITESGSTTYVNEVITLNNLVFATKNATIESSGTTTERVIVYDGAGSTTKIYDKTVVTVISGNTFTSTVTNNI